MAKLWKPPADQGLVHRSVAWSLVLGSVAARGSGLLGGLLCEDRLDGVALGLGLALDVRPDRLGTLEHLRIGLAAFDSVLQRETDFLGDTAVVELGDDVQLRSQVIRDANRQGAPLTACSRVWREP